MYEWQSNIAAERERERESEKDEYEIEFLPDLNSSPVWTSRS